MLDLTATFENKFYQIKLLDGTVLNLKRPTQAIQQSVVNLQTLVDSKDEKQALENLIGIFSRILSRNNENKAFTPEELAEDYDFAIVTYVIQDYFKFWNQEVADQVNFPNSQQ